MTTKRARRCSFARDWAQTCSSEAAQRDQSHFTGGSADLLWLLQARLSSGSPPPSPLNTDNSNACGGYPGPYEHEVTYLGKRNFLFTTPMVRSDITVVLSLEAVEVASSSQTLGLALLWNYLRLHEGRRHSMAGNTVADMPSSSVQQGYFWNAVHR